MEKRKLTKEDIDKVRNVDGFPIGTDEDIIALSKAPYYTACPNPFVKDFVDEYGTPYCEETDDYKREPFAADVSEGKSDVIYNAHTYHTKVPYRAIMRYILHYTDPGDIVLDGFCGTGMTGVAANMCEHPDSTFRNTIDMEMPYIKWGRRYPVLSDLSPIATFISYNYNSDVDMRTFEHEAEEVLRDAYDECRWMYETDHSTQSNTMLGLEQKGIINYTVWSDVLICPHCGKEFAFFNAAADEKTGKVSDTFSCPKCSAKLKKNDCERAFVIVFDDALNKTVSMIKQDPVLINYQYGTKRYYKKPDSKDLDTISRIENSVIPYWYPTERMCDGKESRRNDKFGMTHVHHFFYKRTLYALAAIYNRIEKSAHKDLLRIMFTSQIINISKMNRFRPQVSFPYNPLSGTMYVSSMISEANPFNAYEGKIKKFSEALRNNAGNKYCISTSSTTQLLVPNNSCDYIFTDPPFGDNLNYSELSFLWESWLRVITNSKQEAIINTAVGKALPEYQDLMAQCFKEYFRVLKPNRWMTVEFHNSKNAVWNAIQEALQRAGFIVADVRTLDKQGGSFKQVTNTSAVKQDLVISAYKPKESLDEFFALNAGSPETAWEFVRQHLAKLPTVVQKDGRIELLSERQAFLLFDRMVAYHIMRGIAVPLDAADFYRGLDERYLKRDNMYFLPDQVNEYDMARATCDIETIQFSLFVSDEKSAIGWLYQQLDANSGEGPQTYSELMPKFMQELKAVDKREKMPELMEILEENFLKDEDGKWYIPDLTKSGDIAKLREKNLLKEFQEYLNSKGKLKVFRSEAIRAGFAKLWKDKDYAAIVVLANRLPEETIQEDQNLLMYYDISLSRV